MTIRSPFLAVCLSSPLHSSAVSSFPSVSPVSPFWPNSPRFCTSSPARVFLPSAGLFTSPSLPPSECLSPSASSCEGTLMILFLVMLLLVFSSPSSISACPSLVPTRYTLITRIHMPSLGMQPIWHASNSRYSIISLHFFRFVHCVVSISAAPVSVQLRSIIQGVGWDEHDSLPGNTVQQLHARAGDFDVGCGGSERDESNAGEAGRRKRGYWGGRVVGE